MALICEPVALTQGFQHSPVCQAEHFSNKHRIDTVQLIVYHYKVAEDVKEG